MMADNLPLIPNKGEAICADVRPVLREVFRGIDQLPPLVQDKAASTHEEHLWIEKHKSECEKIWQQEGELKKEFAKRISKKPHPNSYKLYSPRKKAEKPWKLKAGMIGRQDLMPAIEQNAGREKSLWIQNILNRSSCNFNTVEHKYQVPLTPVHPDAFSHQEWSMGALKVHMLPPPPPARMRTPPSEYIVCVPPQLDFINFTLGRVHTQQVRLVNVSKFEIRLSVKPPRRRELDVEICGTRGLTVTSGAAAELKIHFRPRDVRALRDSLRVRVSMGKDQEIAIACYMQPPVLHIIIPNMTHSVLSCSSSSEACLTTTGGDVLDLGSRLLGDVHSANVLLQCSAAHAAFFLITEEAWYSSALEELTSTGSVVVGPFIFHPAWWTGGGVTRGFVRCHATAAGLHTAALRILASTAAARSLQLVADTLHFRLSHISIQAHEKNYDVCSEDDPDCEYYVHLGTAFPNRSLSATVQLTNHSPVNYSFYWSVRPWGVCSCWQNELASETSVAVEDDDSERLCPGAREARTRERTKEDQDNSESLESARNVRVEPTAGGASARGACSVRVTVPDAGAQHGTQRAVLLLILKDIPKESFTDGFTPMVVSTKTVDTQLSPGVGKRWSREVCDVVCAQMEVWWEVVPVRFVLDPPVIPLTYSRRVSSVWVSVRATQLFGRDAVRTRWLAPPAALAPPPPLLAPAHSVEAQLLLPLPLLLNEHPETDVIALTTDIAEWRSECHIERACAPRHPALRPAQAWLGVVPPGVKITANLTIINDTYQHICWCAIPFRWWGENGPSAPCAASAEPCGACGERACACAPLAPAGGALRHAGTQLVRYDVNAPATDRCVATLVRVGLAPPAPGVTAPGVTAPGVTAPGVTAPGVTARAALLAYRVLAPRLMLRVRPCAGDKYGACAGCRLDGGRLSSPRGVSVLRPSEALELGSRSCYRLHITNLTPIPTTVRWEPPIEGEDVLKVVFRPNDFDIGRYAEVEIEVVLDAKKVCGRRLFVQRAQVMHAYKPIYLIVDAAIDGVKILLEVPLGGAEINDSYVTLRGSQREEHPWDPAEKLLTPLECFLEDDRKRAALKENLCHCHTEMVYISPPKVIRPLLPEGEYYPTEILTSPPPLTPMCPCRKITKPILPDHAHPCCLQYWNIPLKTVKTRRLILRNPGKLKARWSMNVRRWPRLSNAITTTEALKNGADRWAGSVRDPGVAVQCSPGAGVCPPGGSADIAVELYADCWGCYHDQLVLMVRCYSDPNTHRNSDQLENVMRVSLQVEGVEPIVVDVWAEAVGAPLQFALAAQGDDARFDATMWLSASDPQRTLCARNTSRSPLTVHAYALLEHEYSQDELPFRVYMRFFDVLPRTCPCENEIFSAEMLGEDSLTSVRSSLSEEMDTGIELYLAADYGLQDYECYKVEPQVCSVPAGASAKWRVTLTPPRGGEQAPPGLLLLRTLPEGAWGPGWRRGEPAAARVSLRPAARVSLRPAARVSLRPAARVSLRPAARVSLRPAARVSLRPAARVSLRPAARGAALRLSRRDVRVRLCALDLPYRGEARFRKHFRVQNTGSAPVAVRCATRAPWRAVLAGPRGACGDCGCLHARGRGELELRLLLEPWSSTAMCVEVCVRTEEIWPKDEAEGASSPARYPPRRQFADEMTFYSEQGLLQTLPLVLEVEFPQLFLEPASLDLGFVTDGDTRKTYFTVWHSSPRSTLELSSASLGGAQLQLFPRWLRLPPGARERVYLQYTARWAGGPAPAERVARVAAAGGAGAWCRAELRVRAEPVRAEPVRAEPVRAEPVRAEPVRAEPVRAEPVRGRRGHASAHDFTDDTHLLAPSN